MDAPTLVSAIVFVAVLALSARLSQWLVLLLLSGRGKSARSRRPVAARPRDPAKT